MNKKRLNWILIACVIYLIILFTVVGTLYYLFILPVPPPPRTTFAHLSVESHEDVWVIRIDDITHGDQSLSSISTEGIRLEVDINRESVRLLVEMELSKIKDNWSDEYRVTRMREDGVESNKTTISMNRVIWNDMDGDGRLSIGDTMIIEKEGGKDWQILPDDYIGFVGPAWSLPVRVSLPNFTENHVYDMVVVAPVSVLEGKRFD